MRSLNGMVAFANPRCLTFYLQECWCPFKREQPTVLGSRGQFA